MSESQILDAVRVRCPIQGHLLTHYNCLFFSAALAWHEA
jgi:hypothetical protein